jgi:hypothetical protein
MTTIFWFKTKTFEKEEQQKLCVKEMTWGNFGFFVFESSATFYGRRNIKSGFFQWQQKHFKVHFLG